MISIHSYIRIYRYIRLNRSYIIYHHDAYIPRADLGAAITIFVYTLTTALTPLADVWEIGFQGWSETWQEPLWTARLPLLVLCGVISGVGGLLGTLAFACSGSSSGLVSMIENGTYTMMSAIIIALYFREHPQLGRRT